VATNKPTRGLRQADTIRSRVEKAKIKDDDSKKPRRLKETSEQIRKPVKAIAGPLGWIGRHFIPRYFRRSWQELKLVTWPKRRESRQMTMAVILFAIVLGLVVTLVDYGLDKIFKKVVLKQ
jgi:preprotein translocase SecE subunit